MAKGDIKVLGMNGSADVPVKPWQTEAGATAILAGEPLKLKSAGSPYVIPLADDDLTIGTDTVFIGIAQSDSTQTASADGVVSVYVPLPGVVYEAKATTSTNVDTLAKVKALENDRVTMDLSSGVYTIDENAGDGANNAFYIVGGDHTRGTIQFTIRAAATWLSA